MADTNFDSVVATTFTGNLTGDVTGNVTGNLEGNVTGNLEGNVTGNLEGNVTGNVSGSAGSVTGALTGLVTLSKDDSYELATAEKDKQFYAVTLSDASKVITLGNTAGTWCIVHNAGDTNAFTLKNVADDDGTSLDAGQTAIVIPSATANASIVIVLN
jgi:hypothetical protein